jgi:hypothetical protein
MSGDTQMDLLGRDGLRLDTTNTGTGSAPMSSSTDPFSTPIEGRQYNYSGPSRSSTLDGMSPIGTSTLGRQSSQEALLSHATMTPTIRSQATNRRLALHDGFGEEEGEGESSDLKRETLAALEEQPGAGGPSGSGNRRPRRRQEDVETEYVVHRDGGRARVELPPRYDEVQWEER